MVSIKNIQTGGNDKISLFILISIAVHALTLILLGSSPGTLSWLLGPDGGKLEKERPLTVELLELPNEEEEDRTIEIVDLPDDPSKESSPPEEIVRYARSSRKAEVEEFPEETVRSGKRVLFPSPERDVLLITRPESIKDKPGAQGDGSKSVAVKEAKPTVSKKAALKENKPLALKQPRQRDAAGELKAEQLDGAKESLEDIALLNGDFPYPAPSRKTVKTAPASAGDTPEKAATPRDISVENPEPATASGGARAARVRLMPSPGRLAQITKEAETYEGHVPAEAKRGKTLLLNTTEFKYQEYFMHIKRKIEHYWDYPVVAARLGQQGRLKIKFIIMRDGTVKVDDIELTKGSNYSILDDSAVTAIRLAAPFNPFPKGFEADDITIKGSFEYSLYGYPGARR